MYLKVIFNSMKNLFDEIKEDLKFCPSPYEYCFVVGEAIRFSQTSQIERKGLILTTNTYVYVKGHVETPIYNYGVWVGPVNQWRDIFRQVFKDLEKELPELEQQYNKRETEKYAALPKPII